MTPAGWISIAMVLVVLAGVMNTMHQSLRDLSRKRIEDLVSGRGGERGAALEAVLDDPVGHALAAAAPRMLFEAGAVACLTLAVAGLRHTGALTLVDLAIGGGAAVVGLWLVALALPLALSEHVGERVVIATARMLRLLHAIAFPVRRVLGLFDEITRRLAGEGIRSEAEELRDDLLDVVTEGELGGQLDESERGLIEAAIRFREIDAERIMTPRTEILALEYTDDLEAVKAGAVEIGHSRIPVYRESLDRVEGILYAKDLLAYLSNTPSEDRGRFELRTLLRDATFVPEAKSVRDLLSELIAKGVHMALVADEYGGTSGLVTMEDIIEEAFGEIRDEYDEEELEAPPPVTIDETTGKAEAEAKVTIHELNIALRVLNLELPESEEYDTVGGLVVTELGRIPEAGESVRLEKGILITVLDAEPRRVLRVRIEPCSIDDGTTTEGATTNNAAQDASDDEARALAPGEGGSAESTDSASDAEARASVSRGS